MSKQMEKATETAGFLDGRDYTAAFLYKFHSLLVGNGVYANELAPLATNENMTITHGVGHAWINGVYYENTTPFVLDIGTADGSLNRYDSLMIRLNLSINEAYAVIVQGEYAATPTPPAVTRNAETYDLKICDIYIPAGCTKITQNQITDTRLDSSVCGVPVFPVEHLDMTTFYRQISADLERFKQEEQADFDEWAEKVETSRLATMDDLVEVVRKTSDDSVAEILDLLDQLNALVDSDTVGELINQINSKLSTSGGTMTGALNVLTPTEAAHAANKEYVDGKHLSTTVTLPAASWVGTDAPYSQTIAVAGILATDKPHVGPVYSDDPETALTQKEAWAAVSRAYAADGMVTFVCFEDKPEIDIPVQLEVNR